MTSAHPDSDATFQHVFTVIMAGGAGTRFWPLSRVRRPKQLLPLGIAGETLLQASVRRMRRHVPAERILVVTSETLADATRAQLPELPEENLLLEPVGRNTAPCIAWATLQVQRRDPDGVLAVMPADPHIGQEAAFADVVTRSVRAAQGERLVTIGIQPTRPETGYGYIEVGDAVDEGVQRVVRFVEKPDAATAQHFYESGRFLWNSGMFFFRADTMSRELETHLPELSDTLADLKRAIAAGPDEERACVRRAFPSMPSISIDHGVMEKAKQVVVVPGAFGWADIGSWTSAWELADRDDADNALPPEAVSIDSRGCYAQTSRGKLVALIGVEDLVVVDTDDALLIMPRQRAQDVREVVQTLRSRKLEKHL